MAFLEGDTAKKTVRQKLPIHANREQFLFLAAPEFFVLAFFGVEKQERPLGSRRPDVETTLS